MERSVRRRSRELSQYGGLGNAGANLNFYGGQRRCLILFDYSKGFQNGFGAGPFLGLLTEYRPTLRGWNAAVSLRRPRRILL